MSHSFSIKSSHPSLKGHFPNNPIVPGVVILEEIIAIIKKIEPHTIIEKIPMVKFTHTILPEQIINVEISKKSETLLSFNCYHDDTQLVIGQLKIKSLS